MRVPETGLRWWLPSLPWTGNDVVEMKDGRYPSIALAEHVFDSVPGRIPALARAMANADTGFLRAVADAEAGLLGAVSDFPGDMARRMADVAGAASDAVPDSLRVLLDALASAALLWPCCRV